MGSRLLTILTLPLPMMIYAGTLQYTPQFDRSTEVSSWPLLTITDFELGRRAKYITANVDNIVFTAYIATDIKKNGNPPRFYGSWATETFPCNRFNETITCDGVYLGRVGEAPLDTDVKAVMLHLLQKSSQRYQESGSDSYPKDYCSTSVSVHFARDQTWVWNAVPGTCTVGPSKPDPVSCNIEGPSTLTHPNQRSDSVGGTIGGSWRITCNGATTAKLTTTRLLDIYSGTGHITTGLYVDRVGLVEKDIDVDQSADVYIISKLETTTAIPGEYRGSGVITISWF